MPLRKLTDQLPVLDYGVQVLILEPCDCDRDQLTSLNRSYMVIFISPVRTISINDQIQLRSCLHTGTVSKLE